MEIGISDELNSIINYSREEAVRTGSYGIAPDHLFLGILRHRENTASDTLRGLGTDLEEMKQFILRNRQGNILPRSAERPESHHSGSHENTKRPGFVTAPAACIVPQLQLIRIHISERHGTKLPGSVQIS